MAADARRLIPQTGTPIVRAGLAAGFVYCLPLAIWIGGQAMLTADSGSGFDAVARQCASATVVVQGLSLAIAIPWLGNSGPWHLALLSGWLVALLPLPLFSIFWLMGGVTAVGAGMSQLILLLVAAALVMLTRLIKRCAMSGSGHASAVATLQVVASIGIWIARDAWPALSP